MGRFSIGTRRYAPPGLAWRSASAMAGSSPSAGSCRVGPAPSEARVGSTAVRAVLAALLVAFSAPAPAPAQCSDPCLQAARGAYRECASDAKGTLLDTIDGCVERELPCVHACGARRQDCRDTTGVGTGLVDCGLRLAAEKERCRDGFPPRSRRREACIDRALVRGFECRRGVRRSFRRALRGCRREFRRCAGACGPGGPAQDAGTCRAEGRAASREALADCKLALEVTASGCLGKDVTCVQDCGDASEACRAPTEAALAAALEACGAQRVADVAACVAANPGGGPSLEACVDTADANAFTCRTAATEAAEPGFTVCAQQYPRCVRGCPSA